MYNCGCEDCQTKQQLNLSISDSFKSLLTIAETAFKKLHERGSYKVADLKKVKEYQDLITATNSIFDSALVDNVVDGKLLESLQTDTFLFSQLKTHAQLLEASRLLLDENKKKKSLEKFTQDFNKINKDYNQTYLEAEFHFAEGSAVMADKWSNFDNSGRYYLQYRTAGDNRVRDTHDALRDITLPKNDVFWNSYTPQNGWNCRCTVVEVLKDKYTLSNSEKSVTAGEKATTQIGKDGKNRLEIFRFNPGKDKVVFPPTHPYSKVAGANKIKK